MNYSICVLKLAQDLQKLQICNEKHKILKPSRELVWHGLRAKCFQYLLFWAPNHGLPRIHSRGLVCYTGLNPCFNTAEHGFSASDFSWELLEILAANFKKNTRLRPMWVQNSYKLNAHEKTWIWNILLEDLQSEFLGRQPLDTWEIGLNMAVAMPLLGWTWSGPDEGV